MRGADVVVPPVLAGGIPAGPGVVGAQDVGQQTRISGEWLTGFGVGAGKRAEIDEVGLRRPIGGGGATVGNAGPGAIGVEGRAEIGDGGGGNGVRGLVFDDPGFALLIICLSP